MEVGDKTIIVDGWSLVPLRLEFFFDSTFLATASGFCYEEAGAVYLITAWHSMSGYHTFTDQPLHSLNGVPNKVQAYFPKGTIGQWHQHELDLFGASGQPLWLEHGRLGKRVDVAALPIPNLNNPDLKFRTPTSKEDLKDMWLRPAMDVFILGYPLGIAVEERFPIWKRATIASEPEMNPEGLPKMIVDTATTTGISGAPVIARTANFRRKGQTVNSGITMMTMPKTQFVGVYSGRVLSDPSVVGSDGQVTACEASRDAQLGIVWKREALEEILREGRSPDLFAP